MSQINAAKDGNGVTQRGKIKKDEQTLKTVSRFQGNSGDADENKSPVFLGSWNLKKRGEPFFFLI